MCIWIILDAKDGRLSLMSELTNSEDPEDGEMKAVAQHLGQDFVNKVLPDLELGPQGGTEAQECGTEAAELPRVSTRVPLSSLLGPLPSAASLGLTDSIHQCMAEEKDDGESA